MKIIKYAIFKAHYNNDSDPHIIKLDGSLISGKDQKIIVWKIAFAIAIEYPKTLQKIELIKIIYDN